MVVCEADKKMLNPELNASDNRMAAGQGWSYDAAGNVITDPQGRSFIYDAESKQVAVENSLEQSIGSDWFDGDGKRIKKEGLAPNGQPELTVFVYNAGGTLIGEYSTAIETAAPKVQYLTADHLVSPRINTDHNGTVTSRTDFLPYGEEITALGGRSPNENYSPDDIRKGFTGYESDAETGLEFAQARMFSRDHARFTSPDPPMASARTGRPSTWNRYVYAINSPLRFTDTSGMDIHLLDPTARKRVLSTLPEEIREKVEQKIDKDGRLRKGVLDKIDSDSENFLDLRKIVNSARIVEVKTAATFPNGEPFSFRSGESDRRASIDAALKDGRTMAEAVEELGDATFPDTMDLGRTEETANGNFIVIVSDGTGEASTAPEWALAGTTAHELYAHALTGVEGKPWKHEVYTDPDGNERQPDPNGFVNRRARDAQTRTENMYKKSGIAPTKQQQ